MNSFDERIPLPFAKDAETLKKPSKTPGRGKSFRISDILDTEIKTVEIGVENEQENYSNDRKIRKTRTIFTDKQLIELETMFRKYKYLSVHERQELAHRMELSDLQVKTWYQNRRTKWKRECDERKQLQPSHTTWLPPSPMHPLLLLLQQNLLPPAIIR